MSCILRVGPSRPQLQIVWSLSTCRRTQPFSLWSCSELRRLFTFVKHSRQNGPHTLHSFGNHLLSWSSPHIHAGVIKQFYSVWIYNRSSHPLHQGRSVQLCFLARGAAASYGQLGQPGDRFHPFASRHYSSQLRARASQNFASSHLGIHLGPNLQFWLHSRQSMRHDRQLLDCLRQLIDSGILGPWPSL